MIAFDLWRGNERLVGFYMICSQVCVLFFMAVCVGGVGAEWEGDLDIFYV